MGIESERRPDAILFRQGMFPGDEVEKHQAMQTKFGSILKGRTWVRGVGNGMNLCTTGIDDSLLFPTRHPTLAGRPRYTWELQPDGTQYGYLVEDARVKDN